MRVERIDLTKENLMDVITDKFVYVIMYRSHFDDFTMKPISEVEVKDLLSEETAIIRIIK